MLYILSYNPAKHTLSYPVFGPKSSITPIARLKIYIHFFTRCRHRCSLVMVSYGYAVQTRIAAADKNSLGIEHISFRFLHVR